MAIVLQMNYRLLTTLKLNNFGGSEDVYHVLLSNWTKRFYGSLYSLKWDTEKTSGIWVNVKCPGEIVSYCFMSFFSHDSFPKEEKKSNATITSYGIKKVYCGCQPLIWKEDEVGESESCIQVLTCILPEGDLTVDIPPRLEEGRHVWWGANSLHIPPPFWMRQVPPLPFLSRRIEDHLV